MPIYLPVFVLSHLIPEDLHKYRWFKTKESLIVEIEDPKDFKTIRSHPQVVYDSLTGIPYPFVCEDEEILLTDFS